MSNSSGYKKQQSLSFAQLLSEAPAFIITLISAIVANTVLLFVDLMDSFGNLLRTAMITVLSKKLSKDLRFEYNYGIGKLEAVVSLICNGIVFCGLLLTVGLSFYAIFFPQQPSDSIIAIVGLKAINVCFDISFYVKQRGILKTHSTAISETNCAAALAALLFDAATLVSLLVIWLFRNNSVGGYISPIISIFIAIYLIVGCVRRTKQAVDQLTDKTLPEKVQIKILGILVRHYADYSQIFTVNSHKVGNVVHVDLYLAFEDETLIDEILKLKERLQEDFNKEIGECVVNIVMTEDSPMPEASAAPEAEAAEA